mmetsp:Transcript_71666/g.190611  ORF Transcript_71666/g.190611 Transcript_71666/m.190611 type:complete len:201 (-) Transcript_71666:1090-1692(-)
MDAMDPASMSSSAESRIAAAASRRQRACSCKTAELTTRWRPNTVPRTLKTVVRMPEVIILLVISWHVKRLWYPHAPYNGSIASRMKKLLRKSLRFASVSLQTDSSPRTYICVQPARTNARMPDTAHRRMETRNKTSTTTCRSRTTDQKQSSLSWYFFMHTEQLSMQRLTRALKLLGGSTDISSSELRGVGPPKKPPAQKA